MSERFDFISTPLAGLTVIQRKPMEDERGFFERLFCAEELREAGLHKPIVQINRSLTRRDGTVRGMHFQYPPHAETKIVSCLRGEIFDVAVDIRAGSPTFLRWHGEVLSAENDRRVFSFRKALPTASRRLPMTANCCTFTRRRTRRRPKAH